MNERSCEKQFTHFFYIKYTSDDFIPLLNVYTTSSKCDAELK